MADRSQYSALAPGRVQRPEDPPLKPTAKPSLVRRAAARPLRTGLIAAAIVAGILALVLGLVFGLRARTSSSSTSAVANAANLDVSPPTNAFPSIQEAFVSFAIEFYYFPDFAGTPDSPGVFSDNLLNNIANISGTKPYIRVGGNSQDLAIYDPLMQNATNATFTVNPNGPRNFETVKIGPSFFDSYQTWKGAKFIHGLNLKNATSAVGWKSLMDTIPVACKALNESLLWWEYGNEPDFYPRPENTWTDGMYVSAWSNGTSAIKDQLDSNCPELASDDTYGYVGPSLANPDNLAPQGIFQDGYNKNGSVKLYTLHNYMGDCGQQTCNLQRDLMNHSNVMHNLAAVQAQISPLNHGPLINPTDSSQVIPFVMDETNSFLSLILGPNNFANVFGAALWTVDYMLYCATIGISRMHMQQGTNFGYNSWQPLDSKSTPKGVSPPYYGNIAVATMLGNIPRDKPQVVSVGIPNQDDMESAYATYVNGSTLARIAVLNMHQYNATSGSRNSKAYTFGFPSGSSIQNGKQAIVRRLSAAGSDVMNNVTFDGWSYDFDLAQGRPVKVGSTTTEAVTVNNGQITVTLNDSSAAILDFVQS